MKNKYTAQWSAPTTLCGQARKELAIILKHPVDSNIFRQCESMLASCTDVQKIYEIIGDASSQKEFKDQLKSIDKHLNQILKKLDEMNEVNLSALDTALILGNSHSTDSSRQNITLTENLFATQAGQMKKAIPFLLQNSSQPSKENNKYSRALGSMAEQFCEIFPNRNPSREPESLFSQLVAFWFNKCLDITIQDPARHIDKILR